LGQVKVGEKTDEIIAIFKLLEALALEGTTVTIDAVGCQTQIAQKIIDVKANYVLAVKGNQPELLEKKKMSLDSIKSSTDQLILIMDMEELKQELALL
jgi:predicted transposase YbfD/YdcC